jgi:type VI secretion system protein ImpA
MDFRIGVLVAGTLLRTDGWAGLADGLAYVRGMVSTFWDGAHPALDPDDGNDPTRRVNVLATLVAPDSILKTIRETPIVESNVLGRFSLRDVMIASGQIPAPTGTEPPTTALIDGAMMAADLDDLKAKDAAIVACVEHVKGLEVALTEKAGAARAMSFGELVKILLSARQPVMDALARRGAAVAAAPGEAAALAARPATGEITSREDAIRALDKVSDYFKRQEPSSPVPIFLERAKRLVSKSFVDIVRDLAPDGLSQVENIRGASRE